MDTQVVRRVWRRRRGGGRGSCCDGRRSNATSSVWTTERIRNCIVNIIECDVTHRSFRDIHITRSSFQRSCNAMQRDAQASCTTCVTICRLLLLLRLVHRHLLPHTHHVLTISCIRTRWKIRKHTFQSTSSTTSSGISTLCKATPHSCL
jgi:hypothetical protein